MNYKNKTAREIADRYLKEVKQIRMMRALTLVVFVFLLFQLRDRINALLAIAFVIVFFLSLRYLRGLTVQQFAYLIHLLNKHCDAEKFTEVMAMLKGTSKQDAAMITLCHAQGLYYTGRYEEAAAELDNVYFKNGGLNTRLLYQTLYFCCQLKNGNLEHANQVRQETEALIQSLKPAQVPIAERTLHIIDAELALAEGRYDDFYPLESVAQSEAINQLQKVSSAFRMGMADLATGKTKSARKHFSKVVSNGNTLSMVTEARRLMDELQPSELPEA